MIVRWILPQFDWVSANVPDDEVFEFVKNLSILGYTATVTFE